MGVLWGLFFWKLLLKVKVKVVFLVDVILIYSEKKFVGDNIVLFGFFFDVIC